MSTLSVITIALNEEKNIIPALESVRWADEILVVDSGSTDQTVEHAKTYTDKVFSVPWQGFGATKNFALQHATGDWVLWLDADERVSGELAAEIQHVTRSRDSTYAAYDVARRAFFLGRWIKHCGWYPSRVTRLFRRGKGTFSETHVHEKLVIEGPIGILRHDILHYTDPDLYHYFSKFNRYTSLAAKDLHKAGKSFRIFDLLIRPPFLFIKMYIFRLGFLDGIQGFILSVVSSAYVFTKYAKMWELQRRHVQEEK
jgi:glycosyltransferase involved in cell wall biosynthesis